MTAAERTENDAVAELAAAATDPMLIVEEAVLSRLVPDGFRLETIDGEHLADHPRRARGTAAFVDPASFIAYIGRHLDDDATTLWGDWRDLSMTAVFNDDEPLDGVDHPAGWRDHRAVLNLRTTEEWDDWTAADRKLMSQVDFASFIEDHVDDITDPPAADMLELAQTFTATENVQFSQAVRLSDGSGELRYTSDIEAGAGRSGDLHVPQTFELTIRPFEGAEPKTVRARLRWRIRNQQLAIGFQLIGPRRVLQDAFEQVADEVHTGTGLDIYAGTAPAAR
ncbi:DUF2303 family protein [Euzebya sp.]|uniref:DUF2303 family protein n=1 Tax=Euzebya sp. TaxID=1971409 RepID=UPI003513EEC2